MVCTAAQAPGMNTATWSAMSISLLRLWDPEREPVLNGTLYEHN